MAGAIDVRGAAELQRFFAEATPSLERKALRIGVRAGARVIAVEAKRRVPVVTGNLRRSITVKAKSGEEQRRKGEIMAIVTHRRPLGNHAHLVERGHDIYRGKKEKGGVKIGKVAARPYMRPARETKRHQVRGEIEKKIRDWIAKQNG